MKAAIDPDLCTGCELCVETCPNIFEMDDDEGIARVKVDEVPEDAEDCARQAEEECPVEAIAVEE
jgi:ferredoxin